MGGKADGRTFSIVLTICSAHMVSERTVCNGSYTKPTDDFFYISDINHEMDVGHAWFGTAGHCTKVHCHEQAVVFQINFF